MAAVHKAIIPIVGLRCGDNLALERHLGRIPGVLRVYVNPATEMAYIEYRDADVTDAELLKIMKDYGYATLGVIGGAG